MAERTRAFKDVRGEPIGPIPRRQPFLAPRPRERFAFAALLTLTLSLGLFSSMLWIQIQSPHPTVAVDLDASHTRGPIEHRNQLPEDVPEDSIEVRVEPDLAPDDLAEISRARAAVAEADRLQRYAAQQSRQVVAKLRSEGLSGADIAALVDVSPQRVSQLLKPAKHAVSATRQVRKPRASA